jgi:XisI protein
MDKLTRYREIIRKELQDFAAWAKPAEGVRNEVVFDPTLDHFELVEFGWEQRRYIHIVLFHIDIIDGKVWIQHDATDRLIATELIRAGIPKEDIVLAFHPADVRPFTGYGIG